VIGVLLWVACGQTPGSTRCEPPGTQVLEIKAAGCFVLDSGKLLLVQQNDGRWSIPGGYVESGESSAAAAVRETWEEARVAVRAEQKLCAVPENRFVAHVCTLDAVPAPFADGKETRDARFMTRQEIEALRPEELRFPDQKEAYLRELAR
jgi:ADP-ribose pyrophosphatase YjhB (NUDIX family)